MHYILGNGYRWFNCTSDKEHEIKLSINIVVIGQRPRGKTEVETKERVLLRENKVK